MRAVIDTNVWVSGLLWGGAPNQVRQFVRQGEIQALMTETLLAEIVRTFTYPKLQNKLQQLQATPTSLLLTVQELTQPCMPVQIFAPTLRDVADLMVLEAAIGGNAEVIVTGDRDLLILTEFSGMPILSPGDFLKRY